MSIRAEDKPKAFDAKFLNLNGQVAQYGDFNFQPGQIVREKTRWKQFILLMNLLCIIISVIILSFWSLRVCRHFSNLSLLLETTEGLQPSLFHYKTQDTTKES